MNSFKSACSLAKGTPVSFNQFQEELEPLGRLQIGIEPIIGRFGIFKAAEHLTDPFHGRDFTTPGSSTTATMSG
jgi:hypothetical protein